MMRVILEPLIGDVPIVGAVTMFFIQRPVGPSAVTSVCPFLLALLTLIPVTIMYPLLYAFGEIDFSSILIDLLHTAHCLF